MAWEIHFGEQVVNLDDLSPDTFEEIAKTADTTLSYFGVYRFPKDTSELSYLVASAAAAHAGIDPPAKPTTMREQLALNEMFKEVTDIQDQPMINGLPPEPAVPESGLLSGAPGDSDGPPTSHDDNG